MVLRFASFLYIKVLTMKFNHTLKQFLTGTIVSLSFAYSAQAGLISVKSIEISNAINNWLQVSEVVALDNLSNDVALSSVGAIATAPDTWSTFSTPAKAIDGITAGNYNLGEIFHEGSNNSHDSLTITFASVVELMSIQIFGRTDCCTDRDFYTVSFFNGSGDTLFTTSVDSRFGAHPIVVLPNTASANIQNSVAVSAPSTLALFGLALLSFGLTRIKMTK
jgi:hypothetical protein